MSTRPTPLAQVEKLLSDTHFYAVCERPRKPSGLRQFQSRWKKPGYIAKGPLFRNLPEHLRPMAHELLQWRLRLNPDVARVQRRLAGLIGGVAGTVLRAWKYPNRNIGHFLNFYARMAKGKRRRLGVRVTKPKHAYTAEDMQRVREQKIQRAEEQRVRRFVPSPEAFMLAKSVPYIPEPKQPVIVSNPISTGPSDIWSNNAR